jgi:hypothetical protein
LAKFKSITDTAEAAQTQIRNSRTIIRRYALVDLGAAAILSMTKIAVIPVGIAGIQSHGW